VFEPQADKTSVEKSEITSINFLFNLAPIIYIYILSLRFFRSKLHTWVNLEI